MEINKINKKDITIILIISFLFALIVEKLAFSNEAFNIIRALMFFGFSIVFFLIMNFISKTGVEEKVRNIVKKFGINKIFIVVALILGIFSSILVPLNEIPDEITHIDYIYQERGLNYKYKDINDKYYGTLSVMDNTTNKVDKKEYFNFDKKVAKGFKIGIPKVAILRHFPQVVGTIIAELLHLPVIVYLHLCELLALLFYIVVCNKALKEMPFKKNLMMLIMLLPVCIQQMASFSYDVVLNSFSFLFIASLFKLRFEKDDIRIIDLLKLLFYLMMIAICKIPYIILGLLVLILPPSRIKIKNISIKDIYDKHKLICIISLIILFILGAFVSFKVLMKLSIGRILLGSIRHILSTLRLFKRSILLFGTYYFESIVGNLGIFNIKTPRICEIFVYFIMGIVTFSYFKIKGKKIEKEEIKFNKKDYIIIYGVALIMIYIIILSMFEWTLYVTGIKNYNNLTMSEVYNYLNALPYIGGVQGRYFIPIIPLLLVPLKSERLSDITYKTSPYLIQTLYYVSLAVYFIGIMLKRFWI